MAEVGAASRPDPEVVAVARRRRFSGAEKARILALADDCRQPGEIGVLLRREGIYSSHLTAWRQQRAAAEREALEPKKRGVKPNPVLAEARRMEQLSRENDRLRRDLAKAHLIIDVQKKVSTLLGLLREDAPDGRS
jgi:transposase-like protein